MWWWIIIKPDEIRRPGLKRKNFAPGVHWMINLHFFHLQPPLTEKRKSDIKNQRTYANDTSNVVIGSCASATQLTRARKTHKHKPQDDVSEPPRAQFINKIKKISRSCSDHISPHFKIIKRSAPAGRQGTSVQQSAGSAPICIIPFFYILNISWSGWIRELEWLGRETKVINVYWDGWPSANGEHLLISSGMSAGFKYSILRELMVRERENTTYGTVTCVHTCLISRIKYDAGVGLAGTEKPSSVLEVWLDHCSNQIFCSTYRELPQNCPCWGQWIYIKSRKN